ncbi:hypothetical protein EMCRGX_G023127 [Ephydatia muelleri]
MGRSVLAALEMRKEKKGENWKFCIYWTSTVYFNGVDHFYTTYFFEIGTALFGQIGNFSYKAEGVQCILKTEPRRDLVPLFRYFNGQDHFYTTDPDEIGTTLPGVIGRYGYQYEHIPGYCYRKREQDTVPLYRYCNLVDHFYTTNPDEIRTIVRGEYGRFGYRYEGVNKRLIPLGSSRDGIQDALKLCERFNSKNYDVDNNLGFGHN